MHLTPTKMQQRVKYYEITLEAHSHIINVLLNFHNYFNFYINIEKYI
jgi:hypothetical protein